MKRHKRQLINTESTPHERSLHALALTRRGTSLSRAAALSRTDPRTVRRHLSRQFHREGNRWRPSSFDREPREMTVLTRDGPEVHVIRDSRTASLLGEHANAVDAFMKTGDEGPLRRLPRTQIRIRGQPVRLETDPLRLERLAHGGELHYELYRR